MPQIYVSYDPADSAFVEALTPSLEKNYDNVILGASLDAAAASQQIASSDLVLYVESPAALRSERVQANLAEAARLGKPIQAVIADLLTDTLAGIAPGAEVQRELDTSPPVDLSSGLDNNRQLFALYSAINQTLQPPPPAPEPPSPAAPAPRRAEAAIPAAASARFRIPTWVVILIILVILLLIGAAIVLLSSAGLSTPDVGPDVTVTAPPGVEVTVEPPDPQTEADQMATVILPLAIAIVGFSVIAITLLLSIRQRFSEVKAPLVFLSYRRDPSWGQARCIADSLREKGIQVFMDVDSIDEGRFAEIIEQAIRSCDHFVPILAPTTLQSDWVRREIKEALVLDKPIIPLLVDGFQFGSGAVPDDVKEIASHNAITVTHEFYDAAMERLATRFIKTR
ncbi:MAG: toll/interleukin-1 receptor domain-containing protein [Anaerolineae bacterium]|nr:toll/interleukin-1 receptor domain-containing protein [Anaerolineae bacterium]